MQLFSAAPQRTLQRVRLAPCASMNAGRQGFKPPDRLVSPDWQGVTYDKTVYTVRLSTGQRRGSALSDYNAGVQICLIGRDGSGFLYRVPALNDPEETQRELHRICQEVDHKAGANCFVAIDGIERQQQRSGGSAKLKHRFQEGSIDEVSFLGPEFGGLSAVLVGPEGGKWYCDEIDVYSSRTGHTDRFICREFLGETGDHPAAYLTPIAPGAVVYGSGEGAVVLSKEQAAQLYSLNMEQYGELKARLLAINAALVALGTAAIYAHAGSGLAAPFALGGATGMLYQLLLAAGAESVGPPSGYKSKAQEIKRGPSLLLQLALANPTVRTALKAGGIGASFFLLHLFSQQSGIADEPGGELKQLLAAFAGFLMFKWAIIGAAMIAPSQQLSSALSGLGGGGRDKSKVDE